MRLGSLCIENFRGIKSATIPFHRKLTLLVGANNAGKTTVLDALSAILTYRHGIVPFSELDFHSRSKDDDLGALPPIKITLTLIPSEGLFFKRGELGRDLQPEADASGNERLRLRLDTRFDSTASAHLLQSVLYRLDGDNEPGASNTLRSFPLREMLPLRAFGIERDLQRGTNTRFSPWGQMLSDIHPTVDTLKLAMAKLREGSNILITNTSELETLSKNLQKLTTVVGMKQTDLSIAPEDLETLMRQLFVVLTKQGFSRGFSGGRHGQGTQSVVLFGIYKALTDTILQRSGSDEINPILTVEEPETHLHPIARRAMAQQLSELPGQVIITTHSAELVAEVEREQVVLLRSTQGDTHVGCVPSQNAKENRKLRQEAHALFAKSLIIAEGAEGEMLPILANALGHDLSALGIELIDARGQDGIPGFYHLFHKSYCIPTVCVADADHKEKIQSFLNKAEEGGSTGKDSDISQLIERAKTHDYYCCPPEHSIESLLAADVFDLVDQYFSDIGEPSLNDWKNDPATREKKVRGGKKRSELSDLEARVCRLADCKTAFPREIAGLLAQTPGRIPSHLRLALERAVALASGE